MNRILLRLSKITELDLYAYFIHVEYRKSTLVKQLLRDFIRRETTVRIRPPHITYDTFTDASMPKVLTISIQLGPQDKDITDYFADCPNGYRSKCMKSILRIMLAPYTQSAFHREAVETYVPAKQYVENEVSPVERGIENVSSVPQIPQYVPNMPYPYPFYGMPYVPVGNMPMMSPYVPTPETLQPRLQREEEGEQTVPTSSPEYGKPTGLSRVKAQSTDDLQESQKLDFPISAPITDNPDKAEKERTDISEKSEEMTIPDWGITDIRKEESIKPSQSENTTDSETIPDELYKLLTGEDY